MMSPKELYNSYSLGPCGGGDSPGLGTPYELVKLVKFLKHLVYPCYKNAPHITSPTQGEDADALSILNTGKDKLAVPYKFVSRLDAEAFSEIQPNIESGTSHAIRNACEITRACDLEKNKDYEKWEHRMATEYMQRFGGSSLFDCLMVLGPNVVYEEQLENRAMGCGDMDCWTPKYSDGTIGAPHSCVIYVPNTLPKCGSCSPCPSPPIANDPCCSSDCATRINKCCQGPLVIDRSEFSYMVPSEDGLFGGNQMAGFTRIIFKHVGILKRKIYSGIANFLNNSGSNFNACHDDMFLTAMQNKNCYQYKSSTAPPITTGCIDRMKTICVLNGNTQNIVDRIKDLIYNGYGIILFSNVGFPNTRDSTGLSYPDRIWYHTYAIIGYDDTKTDYNECVYLIANSWGKWNSGGQPSWGPIPEGSFLITESHLKCMVTFNQNPDFIGCKKKYCPEPCDAVIADQYKACTPEDNCIPFNCSTNQTAFGLAIAVSTENGFPARKLDYKQFFPVKKYRIQEKGDALT